MESNNELLKLFPELRHGLFDAKIKKLIEPYLHASSNVISTSGIPVRCHDPFNFFFLITHFITDVKMIML
jgi:hypothetical protein